MPNRHEDTHLNMFEGHQLTSETYVGGHAGALEAGVFRIPQRYPYGLRDRARSRATSKLPVTAQLTPDSRLTAHRRP
jgi:hypothetical protein